MQVKKLSEIVLAIFVLGAIYYWLSHAPQPAQVSRPGGDKITAPALTGAAYLIDGDSLRIKGVEIRLKGMDAPELFQSCTRDERPYLCGREAQRALSELIADREVSCVKMGSDVYGRTLAMCHVARINSEGKHGPDLGAAMVSSGHALAFGNYEREEAEARQAKRGVWSGMFERPSDWRRHSRERNR